MPIDQIGTAGIANGAIVAADLAAGVPTRAQLPAGCILQVAYGSLGTSFVGTGVAGATNYWVDVTGLSATIIPTSASSRIFIYTNMYIGVSTTAAGYQQQFRILRNGATVSALMGTSESGRPPVTGRVNAYSSDTASLQYRMQMLSGLQMDTPATTSSLTYSIQLRGYSGTPTVYVNRAQTYQALTDDYDGVPLSTITLIEVAG